MTNDTQMAAWLTNQNPGASLANMTAFLGLYSSQQQDGSPCELRMCRLQCQDLSLTSFTDDTGNANVRWLQYKRASSIFGDAAFEVLNVHDCS